MKIALTSRKDHYLTFYPKPCHGPEYRPCEHMEWLQGGDGTSCSYGTLVLNGNQLGGERYDATFTFEDDDLKNWLKNYIDSYPQKGLELLAEMLPRAVAARNEVKK
ncbi:MAG: hypothetical protein OXB98_15150 [Bryobacterales bacterium]|nr:hypothetical protein [Bryobacterales bacterium]